MEQSSNNINTNIEKNLFNYFDITTSQTWDGGKSLEQWTCIKPSISTETEMELPQLLQTTPMMTKSALIPKAPIKKQKQFNKNELKPKKLTYEDEEFYKINEGDVDIVFDSDHSFSNNRHSKKCNPIKHNIFNCDRSAENVSNMKEITQNSNVISEPKIIRSKTKKSQLNNKINENNIPRTQEIVGTCRNTKNNTITKTTCTKKSTNYSKKNLNSCERKGTNIKDEFTHFRI